jgi:hypothetical protein
MYRNQLKNAELALTIAATALVLLGITALGNNAKADDGSGPVSATQGDPNPSAMKCNDGSLCLMVAPQVVHPVNFRGELDQSNDQVCKHESSCAQVNQQNQHGRNLLDGGFHFDD